MSEMNRYIVSHLGCAMTGAIAGATIGSFFFGMGALPGALMGAFWGYLLGAGIGTISYFFWPIVKKYLKQIKIAKEVTGEYYFVDLDEETKKQRRIKGAYELKKNRQVAKNLKSILDGNYKDCKYSIEKIHKKTMKERNSSRKKYNKPMYVFNYSVNYNYNIYKDKIHYIKYELLVCKETKTFAEKEIIFWKDAKKEYKKAAISYKVNLVKLIRSSNFEEADQNFSVTVFRR
jgi:hypothetical protein